MTNKGIFFLIVATVVGQTLGNETSEATCSVTIMSEETQAGKTRELAIILRNFAISEEASSRVRLVGNSLDAESIAELHVASNIYKQDENSMIIKTGHFINPTKWSPETVDIPGTLYSCELWVMDRKITSGSLTLRPRWMEELLPWIGWLPLINFALPATHDSGAYRRFVPGDVPYEVDTIYSQEEDVYTQLLYGIRSFDFKTIVKTKDSDSGPSFQHWIAGHNKTTGHLLNDILIDIQSFLTRYTKEFVFIDFHIIRPYDIHSFRDLEQLVISTFGELYYTREEGSSIHYLMGERVFRLSRSNRRAIVTFQGHHLLDRLGYPAVQQIIVQSNDLVKLENSIQTLQQNASENSFWFFRVVPLYTNIGRTSGSQKRLAAQETGFHIVSWYYRNQQLQETMNMLALDYFASSDLVKLCIDINIQTSTRKGFPMYDPNDENEEKIRDTIMQVVILPGDPVHNKHIREIGILLHRFPMHRIFDAHIEVFRHKNFDSPSASFFVNDMIKEISKDSICIYTNITFKRTTWWTDQYATGTLGFYTKLYFGADNVLTASLDLHPRWMGDMLDTIGSRRLYEIVIPGTHNSGAYVTFSPANDLNTTNDFQEEDPFTQLLYGIRSFDFDITAIPLNNETEFNYVITYAEDKYNELAVILKQMAIFLRTFNKEVIIIHIQKFESGFGDPEGHAIKGLIKLFEEKFGDLLMSVNDDSLIMSLPFRGLITRGFRVILSYLGDPDNRIPEGVFISRIPRLEYFPDDIVRLEKIMIVDQVAAARNQWAHNTICRMSLSANPYSNEYKKLARLAAHNFNFKIVSWFYQSEELANSSNILSFDFVLGTGIIEMSIYLNLQR